MPRNIQDRRADRRRTKEIISDLQTVSSQLSGGIVGNIGKENDVIICRGATALEQFRIVYVYGALTGASNDVMFAAYPTVVLVESTNTIPFIYGVTLSACLINGAVPIKIFGRALVEIETYTSAHFAGTRKIMVGTKLGIVDSTGKGVANTYTGVKHVCLECVEEVNIGDNIVEVRILGKSSGGGGVAVCVTAGGPGKTYTIDVYGNGHFDDSGTAVAATETGKTLYIDQINTAETLPVGTWLRATKIDNHYEAVGPVLV